MRILSVLIGCVLCMVMAGCKGQRTDIQVIPIPWQVEVKHGDFVINEDTRLWIEAPETDRKVLAEYMEASSLGLVLDDKCAESNVIRLQLKKDLSKVLGEEGYAIITTDDEVLVEAATGAGLFYGVQTLLQMAEENRRVPVGVIKDKPRFAYRGMMLDVSRHFFDIDFVKKQIDAMAYFKLNHLHMHLTDAAGWRLEIKQYPRLTDVGAWRTHETWKEWWNGGRLYADMNERNGYGGYYTQQQMCELVDYAKKRFVTIIPEIEMPSHSEEVLVAYPELSCSHIPYKESDFCIGNEQTFEFLENVLLEVMSIFPSEYIHIGGDEASKQSWKTCTLCQKRMEREGLADVDELQSYMMCRIEKFLNKHGRKLLGWDEILEGGLAPNAAIMSWRGTEGGLKAIEMGHKAIMTPGEYCYLDAYQDAPHTQPEAFGGYLPLSKVYAYNPIPDTLDDKHKDLLYGVQGNMFAEYIPTEEHMEYMMYPRMLAIAEVAWSTPENMEYDNFRIRALDAVEHLRCRGYNTFDLRNEVGNRPGADEAIEHLGVGKSVLYKDGSMFNKAYAAGGDTALVDGIRGGWTYGDKRWQGFLGKKGVDVVVDLEKVMEIKSISADFMQICGPGVFMPAQIVISISDDGVEFTELKRIDHKVVKDDAVTFLTFGWEGKVNARYVRYQALRSDFGGFLFVDEIVIV